MDAYVMAFDQGTTSSRAIVFDRDSKIVSIAQKEFPQIFPRPGWVEHDPADLWDTTRRVALAVLRKAGVAGREVAAIGMANQRETTILWDRATGKPVHPAIVWQDRRTTAACAALAFGTLVGGMRMMAGAHFLSDIAFSAIAMLAVVAVLARWIRVGGPAS